MQLRHPVYHVRQAVRALTEHNEPDHERAAVWLSRLDLTRLSAHQHEVLASVRGVRRAPCSAAPVVEIRHLGAAAPQTLFRRDGWTCRYCSTALIAPRVVDQLRRLDCADEPVIGALIWYQAEADHRSPRTGSRLSDFVASCKLCNVAKSDRKLRHLSSVEHPATGRRWRVLDPPRTNWAGLSDKVAELRAVPQQRYAPPW